MLTLVLIIAFTTFVAAILIYDQTRLRRRRNVERGLNIVSERASRRLQFRRPLRSDVAFYLAMAADPVAAEANGWSGDEVGIVKARFTDRRSFARLRDSELVAFERATSKPVGTATFATSPIDRDGARSIGIHVHADHREIGYGREIMAAAIALMQYTPGPIHVGTHVTNVGMQRIMHQLDFNPEPDTQTYTAPDGQTYEAYWYHCGVDVHPPAGLFDS
jgi:RimJ/RimL family protein N-acetyltransferase